MDSHQNWIIWQLIDLVGAKLRIVLCQVCPYTAYPGNDALLESSLPEFGFHRTTDCFPDCRAEFDVNTAIRNDLDIAIREQQIYQYAVVVFCVPYAQSREDFYGSFARSLSGEQSLQIKCAFNGKTYLPCMRLLHFGYGVLDPLQRRARK